MASAHLNWAAMPHMHHWMANPLIDISGDTASARVAVDCLCTHNELGQVQISGLYHDRFERRQGRWAFSERRFELHFLTPLAGWKQVAEGTDSTLSKQVMSIQQPIRNLRPFLHALANRCRNRLPGLATQPRQVIDNDLNPAHRLHFRMARRDMHANPQLLVHQLLHALQVGQALQVFEAFEQAFFFLARQVQDARIGAGNVEQLLTIAVADAGWAGLANRHAVSLPLPAPAA